jgi:hypothetical protein
MPFITMKEYFILRFKMLNRQLTEWGIEPIIGYVVGFCVFVFSSNKLFEKTQYADYIFMVISLVVIVSLNEIRKDEFLKLHFSRVEYFKIRILENLIISSAFIIFLCYQEKYFNAVVLLITVCFLSLMSFKTKANFTFPTPFYKYPFEFAVGFRTNYYIFIFAYFLTFMSISVHNFNLGIFSLIVVMLSCLNYYTTTEDKFYVWIFSKSPKDFIRYKFKIILLYATILCLPIIIGLSVFFYSDIEIILVFQFLGYLFILTAMLAKYSIFPDKLNIRYGIVFGLTLWLPPLLLFIIPYLYMQSLKKLKEIL